MVTIRSSFSVLAATLAGALLTTACAVDAAEEDALPDVLDDEAKADSLKSPTNMGHLFTGEHQFGTLDPGSKQRYLSWTFAQGSDASSNILLQSMPNTEKLDLVLYIYKRGEDRKWHLEHKSPMGAGDLSADLFPAPGGEGEYRVIVKGKTTSQDDRFMVALNCNGSGCPANECLFTGWSAAQTFGSVRTLDGHTFVRGAEYDAIERAQVVAAITAAAGAEQATIDEAFASVDEGKITVRTVADDLAGRFFTQVEFTIGGLTHEVFFTDGTRDIVAHRQGGAFASCETKAESCKLGQFTGDTASMPNVESATTKQVGPSDELDALTQQRIIVAVLGADAPTQGGSLADAFAAAGKDGVTITSYSHDIFDTYVAISYAHEVGELGAYFVDHDGASPSATPIGRIERGAIRECTEF